MKLTDALRAGTRAQHDRLELTTGLPDFIQTDRDLCFVLETFYGFYRAIEPLVVPASLWNDLQLPQCRHYKSRWIEQDLCALGQSVAVINALPVCQTTPRVDNVCHLLGVSYVLEGASMGGQVMNRHIGHLGASTQSMTSLFFSSGGQPVGRNWQRFRSVIDVIDLNDDERQSVVDAAVQCFTVLHDWYASQLNYSRAV